MKCPQCNKDILNDSKSCKECGTNITSAEEAHSAITKTIETPREELTTGSTFANRYQIIEELGKGGELTPVSLRWRMPGRGWLSLELVFIWN
ncbi:MAG: hypothetical protein JRI74_08680 [Deltaproteobacteria bacterium]|nr:hypothetical protein [Deltaproteobacteria bacterium]